MIIVLVAGVVAWRRDRRLWFFGALAAVAVVASLGNQSYWTPWRLFNHVPLVQNILTGRFVAITSLCAAIMLAVIVDRTYGWAASLLRGLVETERSRHRPAPRGALVGVLAGGAALVVAAVAVVPVGSALANNVPLTIRAVALPAWFSDVAPHLPPGQVVLTFPPPGFGASTLAWQAVDSLHFAMATGAGPESILQRAGRERAGQAVIGAASFSLNGTPKPTTANIDALRKALAGWGVTLIAVPNPKSLVPPFDQFDNAAWALGMFTVVLHHEPQFRGDTWVWPNVNALGRGGHHYSISDAAFAACTTPQIYLSPSRLAVPNCVLRSSRQT
jgi:hypothetical protein